jgi:hypothetical protein
LVEIGSNASFLAPTLDKTVNDIIIAVYRASPVEIAGIFEVLAGAF